MNICDYLSKSVDYINGNDYIIEGNKFIQLRNINLFNKGITCLKNFVQTHNLDLDNNKIKSLEGFSQDLDILNTRCFSSKRPILYLSRNKINSLKGFKQETVIDLEHNFIYTLDGFIQTNELYLSGNPLYYLNKFEQKGDLFLDFENIRDLLFWEGYSPEYFLEAFNSSDDFLEYEFLNKVIKLNYRLKKYKNKIKSLNCEYM